MAPALRQQLYHTIRQATLCCLLVLYALSAAVLSPAYQNSRALAVCTALDGADVEAEEAAVLLDVVDEWGALLEGNSDLSKLGEDSYQTLSLLAALSPAATAQIAYAASSPSDAPKDPFATLRYASLRDKKQQIQRIAERLDKGARPASFDYEAWLAMTTQLQRVAANATALGKENVTDLIEGVCALVRGEEAQLSYKKILALALDGIELLDDVDLASLYWVDLHYPQFCRSVGDALGRVVAALQYAQYEDLMEIAAYMPNRTRTTLAAVQYLFGILGVDLADVEQILAQGQSYGVLPASWDVPALAQECAFLLACPPEPTKEQLAQISPHVAAILAQFGVE